MPNPSNSSPEQHRRSPPVPAQRKNVHHSMKYSSKEHYNKQIQEEEYSRKSKAHHDITSGDESDHNKHLSRGQRPKPSAHKSHRNGLLDVMLKEDKRQLRQKHQDHNDSSDDLLDKYESRGADTEENEKEVVLGDRGKIAILR